MDSEAAESAPPPEAVSDLQIAALVADMLDVAPSPSASRGGGAEAGVPSESVAESRATSADQGADGGSFFFAGDRDEDRSWEGEHDPSGHSAGVGEPATVEERLRRWDERRAQRLEEARRAAEAERRLREGCTFRPSLSLTVRPTRAARVWVVGGLYPSSDALSLQKQTRGAPPEPPLKQSPQSAATAAVAAARQLAPLEERMSDWELRRQTKVWAAQLEAQAAEDAECTWAPRISGHARASRGHLPEDVKAALHGSPATPPPAADRGGAADPAAARLRRAAELEAFMSRMAAARQEAERVRRVQEAGSGRHYTGRVTVPSAPALATDARRTARTQATASPASLSQASPAGAASSSPGGETRRGGVAADRRYAATPPSASPAVAERRRAAGFGTSAQRTPLAAPGVPLATPPRSGGALQRGAKGPQRTPVTVAAVPASPQGAPIPTVARAAEASGSQAPLPDAFVVEAPPRSSQQRADPLTPPGTPPVTATAQPSAPAAVTLPMLQVPEAENSPPPPPLLPPQPLETAIAEREDARSLDDLPLSPAPQSVFAPALLAAASLRGDPAIVAPTERTAPATSQPERAADWRGATFADDDESLVRSAVQGLSTAMRERAKEVLRGPGAPTLPQRPPPSRPPPAMPPLPGPAAATAAVPAPQPVSAVSHLVDAAMRNIRRLDDLEEERGDFSSAAALAPGGLRITPTLERSPEAAAGDVGGLSSVAADLHPSEAFPRTLAAPRPPPPLPAPPTPPVSVYHPSLVVAAAAGALPQSSPSTAASAAAGTTLSLSSSAGPVAPERNLFSPVAPSLFAGPSSGSSNLAKELEALQMALELEQRREEALLATYRN